jgi:hypothetical protein
MPLASQGRRTARVGQQPAQAIRIGEQQVGALVAGETPGEAQGQGIRVEDPGLIHEGARVGPAHHHLPEMAAARPLHQAHAALAAQGPQTDRKSNCITETL